MRIMVIDDEPFMVRLLERVLGQLGITPAASYQSAFQALAEMDQAESPMDIILLDLHMPDMDGVEFLRQLEERRYRGALILVSGEEDRALKSVEKLARAHGIRALGRIQKPVHAAALAALLKNWDPAMWDARERASRTAFDADDLGHAIAHGELVNHYQPKVSLATGEVVGVEALVRWNRPSLGLILPDQFIAAAEAHGLIDDLTRVVLAAAFRQARVWREAGLELQLAINVSMDNLKSLYFPDVVANHADAEGVPLESVVFEVTESRLMADWTTALDILNRLRLKGSSLSIDDFGTGHSSLAQLRDIPFDELKVDRSFVGGAAGDTTLRAIYGASLTLGKQLRMRTVAEGVESRVDWEFVRKSGCDLAQGYFIAPPLPAAELVGWVAQWKTRLVSDGLLADRTDVPRSTTQPARIPLP